MLERVAPLSREERKRAEQEAIRRAEEERAAQLQRQQFVVDRFSLVDATLRLPVTIGLTALDAARAVSRRLYEDVVSLPSGFSRLVLAPNTQKDELGGYVVEYDHHARGMKSSMIISRKHAFGVTAIFTVLTDVSETLSSIRKSYAEKLKNVVATFPREPPRLQMVLPRSAKDPRDTERWAAYLPVHSRVGLYRREGALYLIIATNAGHDLTEAVDGILSEDDMTAGKFVVDRRVHRLKQTVLRNVRRVATRIITALGGTPRVDDDVYTRLSDDLSYYELARPTLLVRHNHMRLDAHNQKVRIYVDATCSSAMLSETTGAHYPVWCGRTRDYIVVVRPNDRDASVLPLKTDKLTVAERSPVPEEEHEVVGSHVQYLTPRSQAVGALIKYRTNVSGEAPYKHVSSVHI